MQDNIQFFDVLHTCRAMRRLDTKDVPEDLLVKLIDAANQAPTGSNRQGCRWIIVRESEKKKRLADLNRIEVSRYLSDSAFKDFGPKNQQSEKRKRTLGAVVYQAENMHNAPALIVACQQFEIKVTSAALIGYSGGSIWPAIQNLLLTARALNLAAAPNTLALSDQDTVKEILCLPDNIAAYCLIPIGYPLGNFGPVSRLPVEDTIYWDYYSG
jgi:nitroreductase